MKLNTRSIIGIGAALSVSVAIIALTCAAKKQQPCSEIHSDLVLVTQSMPAQVPLGGEYSCTIQVGAVKCIANVILTAPVPSGATYVLSEPAAMVDGNNLIWKLGSMDVGQSQTIVVRYRADKEGTLASETSVSADPRLVTTTECGKYVPTGVLLEVVDDPDPIQVGETTTFTLRVTNPNTTRSIKKVAIVGSFSAETLPVSTTASGVLNGNNVSWPVIPSLAPLQSFTCTVTAKGVTAGQSLLNVTVTTSDSQNRAEGVEYTTVY
jgi:hypothetical protein